MTCVATAFHGRFLQRSRLCVDPQVGGPGQIGWRHTHTQTQATDRHTQTRTYCTSRHTDTRKMVTHLRLQLRDPQVLLRPQAPALLALRISPPLQE